jgi:hypothetical protein
MAAECLVYMGEPGTTPDAPYKLTFSAVPRVGEQVLFRRRHETPAGSYEVQKVIYRAEDSGGIPETLLIVAPLA